MLTWGKNLDKFIFPQIRSRTLDVALDVVNGANLGLDVVNGAKFGLDAVDRAKFAPNHPTINSSIVLGRIR